MADGGCTGPADTTEANCGDAVINQSSEQCEGFVNLPGQTTYTTALGAIQNFRQYQLVNSCVVCGTAGAAACQTQTYRNCASLTDGQPYIPPTPFVWVVNATSPSGNSWGVLSQMVAIKDPTPGSPDAGDIIHEYVVCREGASGSYTYRVRTPVEVEADLSSACRNSPNTTRPQAKNLAVNLEQNEVWVVYYMSSSLYDDFNGVAFIRDGLQRYCPSNQSPVFKPLAVTVDGSGDGLVIGLSGSGTALRRYSRATIQNCTYQETPVSGEALISNINVGKLNVTPTGDLWLLSNVGTGGISRLTYIANPGPGQTVKSRSLSGLDPQDILVETDSRVLVATWRSSSLKKYRYSSGPPAGIVEDSFIAPLSPRHAVTFWQDPNTKDFSSLWTEVFDAVFSQSSLLKQPRAGGGVATTKSGISSVTADISAGSNGLVWLPHNSGGKIFSYDALNDSVFSYETYCGVTYPGACKAHINWFLKTGNDFLGFKRYFALYGNTLYYPSMGDGPLTAFDVGATPPEDRNKAWERTWGKVEVSATGGAIQEVSVCFSDNYADVGDVACPGGTGWVNANVYNGEFKDPLAGAKYRKRYLRVRVQKDPTAVISSVEVTCKNGACLP
ncbi:MAG: hypothetical protein A3J59_03205 [Candidatus Buchananbacteria bacterium RIFCSPHIGHO2_02_FULL_56_16]|uniref:Uncharacterized protein n=1 Tax=Candidatus Buchananbacteria bacterium RIFCSPHIGHO2_02_FULL_56_16 TaxID=1797542 RepID=A0A1G1YH88_9BACT|nr:MAG: hypothetical protein A3J59_03205 [Candidatus Buchananbacteria bacterium RIFCSPHIGHO2_02_FULL_56_16]